MDRRPPPLLPAEDACSRLARQTRSRPSLCLANPTVSLKRPACQLQPKRRKTPHQTAPRCAATAVTTARAAACAPRSPRRRRAGGSPPLRFTRSTRASASRPAATTRRSTGRSPVSPRARAPRRPDGSWGGKGGPGDDAGEGGRALALAPCLTKALCLIRTLTNLRRSSSHNTNTHATHIHTTNVNKQTQRRRSSTASPS